MRMGIALEGLFCFDSVFCGCGLGYVDVAEAGEMVSEDSGHRVSLLGGVA